MAMVVRRVINTIREVINGIEKRPWIPMALYLGVFVVFVIVPGLLIANLVSSRWRPMPELTPSAKLAIEQVADLVYSVLHIVGAVAVVVVPVVMLCARKFLAAFYTLILGVSGVAASMLFLLVTAPLWFVAAIEIVDAKEAVGEKLEHVKTYKDYHEASSVKTLREILPPGATDITTLYRTYFQGYSVDSRCSVSKDDLMKFASERKYVFKEHNLLDDINRGDDFRWHDKDDTLFSQFPDIENGQVVNHHPDGYLRCVAIDGHDGGTRAEEELLYLYDVKCSILWVKCSR
jgi:hypothetical protein